ncbi:MAG: OB-fold nucleic acid binding domain-containing protein, partial [archaeon]|nr:OB-fold nucleic acid binding domain-containing protein [archaeon]
MDRTHTCGELSEKHDKKSVVLKGWVDSRRDHGNLTFVDIRDRYGLTQIVLNPETDAKVHELGKGLRREFVVRIEGKVRKRPQGTVNL